MTIDDANWADTARELYEAAVFGGDAAAPGRADRLLDRVEAELALARGRILHARFLDDQRPDPEELRLFTRSAELFRSLGDVRGEGEALLWVGVYHQVVLRDGRGSLPSLRRARELAGQAGDRLTLSYAVRHLAFFEMYEGSAAEARRLFEESVRLREEVGFLPGVAAAKLSLAEFAARTGDRAEALALLDEAAALAAASGAHGTAGWIDRTRAELG